MNATLATPQSIESWLGDEAESLLTYKANLGKDLLHLPGPDWVARIFGNSDRSSQVLRSQAAVVFIWTTADRWFIDSLASLISRLRWLIAPQVACA
ncbi:hypothetical protein [Moorena sp. SIO3H5]|uniref:hypothetical protein n=1 Tax=Moorena sp. SIO3H5 TaxID=2607834 RepID=UPI0034411443